MAKKGELPLKGVHKSLKSAIKKLSTSKDPKAIALAAAMTDVNAKSQCGQTNVFKFTP